ncbi:HNH endonuclease signature motif containing protein [Geobacter benzoatilyticus]|uniref:HNH endonuclease n=1 Tax=Geobacter benzoatilyticus TaxID=2815309 RepID=A0ABX7Q362_9BACT|nr:HNH endonuclease signature motif containing protein [Geobacter benzoatilyticus]QSV45420.1 HNH endonuclease [Geobacter benzoatilyticus]
MISPVVTTHRSRQEKPLGGSGLPEGNSCWENARPRSTPQGYIQLTIRDREKKITRSKMQHIVVWELHYGAPVPAGYVIHHRDENRRNNRIKNLACMPPGAHVEMHAELKRLRARLPPEGYATARREVMNRYELEVYVPRPLAPARGKRSDMKEETTMYNALDIKKIRKVVGMTGKIFGEELSVRRYGVGAKPVTPQRLYEWETDRRSVPDDVYRACVGIVTDEWACRRREVAPAEKVAIDVLFASLISPALGHLFAVTSQDDSGALRAREIFAEYVRNTYGFDIVYVWEGYEQ